MRKGISPLPFQSQHQVSTGFWNIILFSAAIHYYRICCLYDNLFCQDGGVNSSLPLETAVGTQALPVITEGFTEIQNIRIK